MTGLLKRHGPLLMALLLFALAVAWALMRALHRTDGHFTYVLDDPYIHMAQAKNLASHGVWGVTRHAFTAASSSPLWTVLLALCFRLAGPRELLPFVLGGLGAVAVLVLVHESLVRRGLSPALRLVALLAVVFLSPLPTLVFCGLEHTVHLLLTLVFALMLAREIDPAGGRRGSAGLLVAAMLLGAIRYEALFTVLVGGVLLAVAGRWRLVVAVGLASAVAPVGFAIYSMAHGGEALPNSVLLKGNLEHARSLAGLIAASGLHGLRVLVATPHLLALCELLLGAVVVRRIFHRGPMDAADALPLLVVGGTLLHLQFAQVGWFYRYEAYLMGTGFFALAWALPSLLASLPSDNRAPVTRVAAWLLVLLVAAPMAQRATVAYLQIPTASMNVYQQQVQMAAFVREHYTDRCVALDDIGVVTFRADIRCLDLVGLANLEALRARRAGRGDARFISGMADRAQASIAIVYDKWFANYVDGGVPHGWTRVGLWRCRDNVACYSDSVSFYALTAAEVAPLAEHLRQFGPRLPAAVEQSGLYRLEGSAPLDHGSPNPAAHSRPIAIP